MGSRGTRGSGKFKYKIQQPHTSIYNQQIYDVIAASTYNEEETMNDESEMIQTEIDSHANMVVIGKHCHILAETGRHVDVNPFMPAYKALKASIVDAAIQYDCPNDRKSYILIIRGAIYVPSMTNNLVPPFVLREVGIVVNDKAKIHTVDPRNDNHVIIFKETGFWIRLTLWGVFSYFATVKPTEETLCEGNDVYILTPVIWHPHSNAYAHNEDSMVDWEGNIHALKDRKTKLVFDDIPNVRQVQSTSILAKEAKAIDDKCETTHHEENEEHSIVFPQHTTNVFSLTMINDPMWMTKMME